MLSTVVYSDLWDFDVGYMIGFVAGLALCFVWTWAPRGKGGAHERS